MCTGLDPSLYTIHYEGRRFLGGSDCSKADVYIFHSCRLQQFAIDLHVNDRLTLSLSPLHIPCINMGDI
jgi:hypothetical protein